MNPALTAPIGVYGGTFDPVHEAHLRTAMEVAVALDVVDFRMVPAGIPPHRASPFASAADRVAMLRLAIRECPALSVDEREVRRAGPSWMVTTLESLRAENPHAPLLLVIGQDAANGLDRWHEWRKLFAYAHLVVMTRPGEIPEYHGELKEELAPRLTANPADLRLAARGRVYIQPVSPMNTSSTGIRASLKAGTPTVKGLPPAVFDYIMRHQLYGTGHTTT